MLFTKIFQNQMFKLKIWPFLKQSHYSILEDNEVSSTHPSLKPVQSSLNQEFLLMYLDFFLNGSVHVHFNLKNAKKIPTDFI